MRNWNVVDAFRHLGGETNNSYAWSAQSADGEVTIITLWRDEIEDDGTRVRANFFNHPKLQRWANQRGNKARKKHLQDIWDGDRKFKVVMLEAKDVGAETRSAKGRWPDNDLTMTLLNFDAETGEFLAEGVRTIPTPTSYGDSWTEQELAACVMAYRKLWLAQGRGEKTNKAALRRQVVKSALQGRGESAYEFRMQNISAVMDELGLAYVQGYLPLRNVGVAKARIIELINDQWDRLDVLEQPTANPDELETRVASATQKPWGPAKPPPPGNKSVSKTSTSSKQFIRDPNVIAWVRQTAAGHCEACDLPAPFTREDGVPYLEVHHMRPLSEGGPDTTDNAIAGCPNCHRQLHYADNKIDLRKAIVGKIDRLKDHPKRKV